MRHDGPVRSVAFSSDGSLIATSADDGTIRRWDAWSGEPRGEPIRSRGVGALSLSPDASIIAAPCAAGEPFLWNADDGGAIHEPPPQCGPVLAIAFASDGRTIAVAHDDGAVWLREAPTGRPLGDPLTHPSAVRVLEFDAGGEKLLTGSLDGGVRLWDISGRIPLVTLALQGEVRALAFRPGGDAFATVCEDGTARLWECSTGRPIGEPLAERSRTRCLAFRPDGTMVATGSRGRKGPALVRRHRVTDRAAARSGRRRQGPCVQPGRAPAGQRRDLRHGPLLEAAWSRGTGAPSGSRAGSASRPSWSLTRATPFAR